MINSNTISHWLDRPFRLSQPEQESLSRLVSKYPFFVPLRYMEAAQAYATDASSVSAHMQLYIGNRLFFYEIMQSSLNEKVMPLSSPGTIVVPGTEEPIEDFEKAMQENQNYLQQALNSLPADEKDPLVQPVYADNYFLHQGIKVSDELPPRPLKHNNEPAEEDEDEKSLMVMMTFDEWLAHFKTKKERKKQEEEDRKMLRTLWQREKLAAAMEEEGDEIPENVFEMAINSIAKEDTLVSEPLAEIHAKQGRFEKAIEIYRKLSLQNPQKKSYFAAKIDQLIKEKQS